MRSKSASARAMHRGASAAGSAARSSPRIAPTIAAGAPRHCADWRASAIWPRAARNAVDIRSRGHAAKGRASPDAPPAPRSSCAPCRRRLGIRAGEHATGAVVVAHLDRALKTASGAGIGGPVELGADFLAAIVRSVAEDAAIVELRRAHDLAGIVEVFWIEPRLDLIEGVHEPLAEHLGVEFG